jgi:hypothetical protein
MPHVHPVERPLAAEHRGAQEGHPGHQQLDDLVVPGQGNDRKNPDHDPEGQERQHGNQGQDHHRSTGPLDHSMEAGEHIIPLWFLRAGRARTKQMGH